MVDWRQVENGGSERKPTVGFRKKLLNFFITQLAHGLIFLLKKTYRFHVIGKQHRLKAESLHPQGSFAIASWHEHCFGCILGHAYQNICLLVSRSFDGDITASLAHRLGLKSVRGSSSRGGKAARDEYLEKVQHGLSIAITVDGPKGPRHQTKSGIIDIASKAGIAVLPTTSYAKHSWVLHKSWDQFKIPKPFSKVYIAYGQPILFPKTFEEGEFEKAKEQVARALFNLEQTIGIQVGR